MLNETEKMMRRFHQSLRCGDSYHAKNNPWMLCTGHKENIPKALLTSQKELLQRVREVIYINQHTDDELKTLESEIEEQFNKLDV